MINAIFNTKKFLIPTLWILVIAVLAIIIVRTDYAARENDSRLYSIFTQQLAGKPFSKINTLEWQGSSAFSETETPYVRDHLIGQFIFPVIIAKLGYSSKHAIYLANIIYKALSLYFIYLLVSYYFEKNIALLTTILIQLTPISLNYQMRANHEPLLLLLTLASLYCSIRVKDSKFFSIPTFLATQLCFLVKGIAFIPIMPIIFIANIFNQENIRKPNIKQLLILSAICFSTILTAIAYEYLFRSNTGHSFFEKYIQVQIMGRSFAEDKSNIFLLSNIKTFTYYIGRVLVYSMPWSLIAIIILLRNKFKLQITDKSKNLYLTLLLSSLIYILVFSISSRTASRYIYPAYYLLNIITIIYFFEQLNLKERYKFISKETTPLTLFFILTISKLIFS
ncbi:glycosyltransferase family 39 protein [Halobacteriovorax marinus]|uniref:glycosyltransferase family 39 protein n=1 Tax=Halobacteriovorax marinus TaxID=97084 RepID=UPI003A959D2D